MTDDEKVELAKEIIKSLPEHLRISIFPENVCRQCGSDMTPRKGIGKTYYTCWGCFESDPYG